MAFNSLNDSDVGSWHVITSNCDTSLDTVNKPHLRMVEAPARSFRLRYGSEGSHGTVCGISTHPKSCKSEKTFPKVKLVNYPEQAVIKVQLYEDSRDCRHPADDSLDQATRSQQVPRKGSYVASFNNIAVKLLKREESINWLIKSTGQSRDECARLAKTINLRAVRLRFSAHGLNGEEICPPLYSAPITDSKACMEPKIVNYIPYRGNPGDEMWIAVDGLKNKRDIEVVFYEETPNGDRNVFATIKYPTATIHNLALIILRTPKCPDLDKKFNKQVKFELRRTTDGLSSEPRAFEYKPGNPDFTRKRSYTNSTSSDTILPWSPVSSAVDSASGSNLETWVVSDDEDSSEGLPINLNDYDFYCLQNTHVPLASEAYPCVEETSNGSQLCSNSDPVLSQANITQNPPCHNYINYITQHNNYHLANVESNDFEADISEDSGVYFRSSDTLFQLQSDSPKTNSMNKVDSQMSAKASKTEIGHQVVKKVISEIYDLVKQGIESNREEIVNKLEDVFEIRCHNGDTFLHTMLLHGDRSLKKLITLIHSMRMSHLLNLTNSLQQSILHLAVVNDLPRAVPTLVSRGCDPVAGDREGNSPLHYAVLYRSCLGPLLASARQLPSPPNIDVYNNDKHTPLHWAAMRGCPASARALLSSGADRSACDARGRTPLHLAVEYDTVDVVAVIAEFTPSEEIDAVDGRGYTALQIVCELDQRNSLEIARLLLDKQANPLKYEDATTPAWELAKQNPAMLSLINAYEPSEELVVSSDTSDSEYSHSESEDEFISADEGMDTDTML